MLYWEDSPATGSDSGEWGGRQSRKGQNTVSGPQKLVLSKAEKETDSGDDNCSILFHMW